jgi:hypothetical protein
MSHLNYTEKNQIIDGKFGTALFGLSYLFWNYSPLKNRH